MHKIPITKNGAEKLRQELEQLKHVERHKIIQAIAEARALGDLKENAEYHAAKERQAFIEGKIRDIESKLSNAQIIDVTQMQNTGQVTFGATVHLLCPETQKKVTYQIVGEDEANIKVGKISIASPMARALIGKSVLDFIEVLTPNGTVEYQIIAIELLA
jgi:transcription elongation factor GreA